MRESHAVAYAKQMIAIEAIVFFEVWVDDEEDLVDVAHQISDLGASEVIDNSRRVVKVFTANPMPKGFGFL